MSRLNGKVALITGGAQGQGAAEAAAFVREGARVVIGDVNESAGRAVADDSSGAIEFIPLDVSQGESWRQAVDHICWRYSRLDVLVNNAALYSTGPLFEVQEESLDRMISVNLKGAFLGIRTVGPSMIDSGGGSIINISSTAGVVGHIGHSVYGMTKWGLRGLTRVAAAELSPSKIRVNCLIPGSVTGPMLGRNIPEERQRDPEYWTSTPLRRAGEPSEIAEAAVFLASDESSYVTGTDLIVDGGVTSVR